MVSIIYYNTFCLSHARLSAALIVLSVLCAHKIYLSVFFVGTDTSLRAASVLATGNDGSIFMGDYQLIRRYHVDGNVSTVVDLRYASMRLPLLPVQ